MKTRIAIAAIAALFVVLATSCSTWEENRRDAPVSHEDDSPAIIINMPDTYANMAWKCYAGNGIYTSRGDVRFTHVVPDDPNCDGFEEVIE